MLETVADVIYQISRFSIIDSTSWVSFCSKNKQKDSPIWCKFKKWKTRKGRPKRSTLKLYLIIWMHGGVYSFLLILCLCTCLHLHLFVKCSLSGKGVVSWPLYTSCWALSNFHCCLPSVEHCKLSPWGGFRLKHSKLRQPLQTCKLL